MLLPFFLIFGFVFGILAGLVAYLITYKEMVHHYAETKTPRWQAFKVGLFTFLFFFALSALLGAVLPMLV